MTGAQKDLGGLALANGGYLPAGLVRDAIAGTDLPVEQIMLGLIAAAATRSLPALSGFTVGAAGQGASGAIYLGCNIEFSGLPLSQTIHAEQCTVVNAASNGETGLVRLAVSAPPCGYCRQFLFELSTASTLQILLAGSEPKPLTAFLPGAFGPGDLGVKAGLLGSPANALEISTEYALPDVAVAALNAARHAYAPYTKALAGAALKTKSGRIYSGSSMENAAFNPSVAPMQAAIASAIIAGVEVADLVEAVLIEVDDSKLGYEAASRAVLDRFSPGIHLQTFRAQRSLS